MTVEPRELLQVARIRASDLCPYFTKAVLALSFVPKEGINTIGVDPFWRCYYDPVAVQRWGEPEIDILAGALVHEAQHLLREHHARAAANHYQKELANICGDCEINDGLVKTVPLPPEGVLPRLIPDPTNKGKPLPDDLILEEYYERLKDQVRHIQVSWSCGSGATGEKEAWEDPDPAPGEPGLDEYAAKAIREAVARDIASRPPGSVPGDWVVWANGQLLPPEINWQSRLRSSLHGHLTRAAGHAPTFQRPSRRRSPGVILPGRANPTPQVAVVLDSSGSMASQEITRALSECNGLLLTLAAPIHLLICDTEVHVTERIRSLTGIEVIGGGGTSMANGIGRALDLSPRPSLVICFTDCYTPWPDKPTTIPLVVVNVTPDSGQHAPEWAEEILLN